MPAGDIAFETGDLKICYLKNIIFGILQPAGSFGTDAPHHCTSDIIGVCQYGSRERGLFASQLELRAKMLTVT